MEILRSPDFKQVYAIGAIGGHSPYDFRIAFYNDSPKSQVEGGKSVTVMERKIDTEIILSPLAAKELANWLGEHIKDYEKVFGEIKRPGSNPGGSRQSREILRICAHPGLYVRPHELQRESVDSQRNG